MSIFSAFFRPHIEQGLKAPVENSSKEVAARPVEKLPDKPVSELDKPLGKEVTQASILEKEPNPQIKELDKPLGKEVTSDLKDMTEQSLTSEQRTEDIDGKTHYYDDNGKIYRIDNELLPNNHYEINGYNYETDEKGRIVSAEGKLHLKERDGRLPIRDSIEDIGKGDQMEGDDRGHLIGDQFDGANGLENMVAQDAGINRNDFRIFENQLAEEVRNGKSVSVKVEPIYDGNSQRPSDIVVTYNIDGKDDVRIFPNSKEDL